MDRRGKDTWTVFKIMGEFVEGFETLRDCWPSVSVFGGARIRRGNPIYRETMQIGEALSRAGLVFALCIQERHDGRGGIRPDGD